MKCDSLLCRTFFCDEAWLAGMDVTVAAVTFYFSYILMSFYSLRVLKMISSLATSFGLPNVGCFLLTSSYLGVGGAIAVSIFLAPIYACAFAPFLCHLFFSIKVSKDSSK